MHSASRKSDFFSTDPLSHDGSHVSQVDTPFSAAMVVSICWCGGRSGSKFFTWTSCCLAFFLRLSLARARTAERAWKMLFVSPNVGAMPSTPTITPEIGCTAPSAGYDVEGANTSDCEGDPIGGVRFKGAKIMSTKGCVTCIEALCSMGAILERMGRAIPPHLAGNSISALAPCVSGTPHPKRAWRSSSLIKASISLRRCSGHGEQRKWYSHFPTRPFVSTA